MIINIQKMKTENIFSKQTSPKPFRLPISCFYFKRKKFAENMLGLYLENSFFENMVKTERKKKFHWKWKRAATKVTTTATTIKATTTSFVTTTNQWDQTMPYCLLPLYGQVLVWQKILFGCGNCVIIPSFVPSLKTDYQHHYNKQPIHFLQLNTTYHSIV